MVCFISSQSWSYYCSVCSLFQQKEPNRISVSRDSELCETFLPWCNHWPCKLCLTENQRPYSTNNTQSALIWSVMPKEKESSIFFFFEVKKIKHLPLLVRNCTGRKTTEQHLDNIAQEWITSSFLNPKPVNTILYIKHCAKDLKNKILQKWNI